MRSKGFSSGWAMLIVVFIVLGAVLAGLWPEGKSFQDVTGIGFPWEKKVQDDDQESGKGESMQEGYVSVPERVRIERWITDNGLNQYGDPADTLYAGGSPLFDEATGKSITRWEYIFEKHPDRPWRK